MAADRRRIEPPLVWCDEIRRWSSSDCELSSGTCMGGTDRANTVVGHALHFRYMVFRSRGIGRFIHAEEE
jgi:hypothetical protein